MNVIIILFAFVPPGISRQAAKPVPSAEELDLQLDQYMAGSKSALDRELDNYMRTAMETDAP